VLVHGGNFSFAKTAKGARVTLETDLVIKSPGPGITSMISGWEGWTHCGVRGAIVTDE